MSEPASGRKREIVIAVNSPGEIAGWMAPAVRAIRRRLPDCPVRALLLPCVFASGREAEVIGAMQGVDELIPSSGFLPMLFEGGSGQVERHFLHIGGELALTGLLASAAGTGAWGYQWGTRASDPNYAGYFVKSEGDRDALLKRGVPGFKIHVTGDLLYDAVMNDLKGFSPAPPPERVETIAFMCGSRQAELEGLLPMFLRTAEILSGRFEGLRFKTVVSPFIDWDAFTAKGVLSPMRGVPGSRGVIDAEAGTLRSEGDPSVFISLARGSHHAEMSSSDFIVAIPGTKTGEAACLGKPMLVVLPLNRLDMIPAFGLVGLLDWIPVVGRSLKGMLIAKAARRFGFAAQPNILSGREIVPELKGVLSPEDVADSIGGLISDGPGLERMRRELSELYSPFRGASERLADVFCAGVLGPDSPDAPYLSVVICTRNRCELLRATLLSLDDQTLPSSSYEIIVVDDGSEDSTGDVVAGLSLKCSLRYFRKDWGGRSETRNVGIRMAKGEICVFVDDDILARNDFLESHAKVHRRHPGSIVRGPIVNVTEHAIPDYRPSARDFSGALFCTCNASAPTAALRELGGFDESFKEYGYEDNDMGWRLYRAGLRRRFCMDAVVFHYKPHKTAEALPGEIRNSQEMARSAVMFARKHRHWKTSLSAKTDFLSILCFRLTGFEFLNRINVRRWKAAAAAGRHSEMARLEKKIKRHYYMTTLIEELGRRPERDV